ncbi:hypothetical protein TNCV_248461 [Trichonephila clavipes]|nr:hypothetical protein TNCV_248461 [Trichonephila clavipes]
MVHTLQEFQQASGTVVSINAICKEAHLLGFHGPAAAHISLITHSNHTTRLKWCKRPQISGNSFSGSLIKIQSQRVEWQSLGLMPTWRKTSQNALCLQ